MILSLKQEFLFHLRRRPALQRLFRPLHFAVNICDLYIRKLFERASRVTNSRHHFGPSRTGRTVCIVIFDSGIKQRKPDVRLPFLASRKLRCVQDSSHQQHMLSRWRPGAFRQFLIRQDR